MEHLIKDNKQFLTDLNSFISNEISLLNQNELKKVVARERYLIYREAFDRFIDYSDAYQKLLSEIKDAYDYEIYSLETKKNSSEQRQVDMNRIINYPITLINLEKARGDLLEEMKDLELQNEKLKRDLNEIERKNEKFRRKTDNKYSFLATQTITYDKKLNDDENEMKYYRPIPGVDIDKATDHLYLNDLLANIEASIGELTEKQTKKYSTKEEKNKLELLLTNKIEERDHLEMENKIIQNQIATKRMILNAVQNYYKNNNGDNKMLNIEDLILKTISESIQSKSLGKTKCQFIPRFLKFFFFNFR
jgi:hypothetical protein